ncbi:MAG: hypothetical protein AAF639_02200 [Chloroflexota bacterium]
MSENNPEKQTLQLTEIQTQDYRIWYDEDTYTITCSGTLRLPGRDYAPVVTLLNRVVDSKPEMIILNLHDLKFLNSFGINVICQFVIRIQKLGVSQLTIDGTKQYPWQRKSLRILPRLMPALNIQWT